MQVLLFSASITKMMRTWAEQGSRTKESNGNAKSEEVDKITGLNIGADDYVTKPITNTFTKKFIYSTNNLNTTRINFFFVFTWVSKYTIETIFKYRKTSRKSYRERCFKAPELVYGRKNNHRFRYNDE